MATAYIADSFNQALPFASASSAQLFVIPFRFNLTAAFVLNDTLALTPIPGGAFVAGYMIWIPQLDSGSGAITLNLGDSGAGNAAIYASGVAVGRNATYNALNHVMCWNGTTAVAPVLNAIPNNYAVATPLNLVNLLLTIAAAPGTGVATGKIKGELYMQVNGVVPLS